MIKKNYISLVLLFSMSCLFAEGKPSFEETDENECQVCVPFSFSKDIPLFEEDNEPEEENEPEEPRKHREPKEQKHIEKEKKKQSRDDENSNQGDLTRMPLIHVTPQYNKPKEAPHALNGSYCHWTRYKSHFDIETIVIRFPYQPIVSRSCSLITAYAYDYSVMYSFSGYYPPIPAIDYDEWFCEILDHASLYPYNLVSYCSFQLSNGDWVMDYVIHDYVQNLMTKARAIVTPFNGYIVQCTKPQGAIDYFDYFLDNFWIKCHCCY